MKFLSRLKSCFIVESYEWIKRITSNLDRTMGQGTSERVFVKIKGVFGDTSFFDGSLFRKKRLWKSFY